MLTRRQTLRMTPASLLSLGLWPGALSADEKAAQEVRFAVFNDLHVWDRRCTDWLAGVVKGLKGHKPDLVLLAGDLAEHGTAEQLSPVRDLFKTLGVPVHVVIGNHDWKSTADCKAFDEAFPKSRNYTFDHGGWQFVGLDSSHGVRSKVAVQPDTLSWLDDNLGKLDKKKPMVLFTHFPLGEMVPMRVTNPDAVGQRFKGYNLRAVFGGHHHGFTERKFRDVVLTTNRCCSFRAKNHDGTREKGYFVCTAKEGTVTRKFVEVKV
ncbi:MAG: metallophosphoesterase [Gemmataceae bacterium]